MRCRASTAASAAFSGTSSLCAGTGGVRRADGHPALDLGTDQRSGHAVPAGREGRASRSPDVVVGKGGGHQVFGIRGVPRDVVSARGAALPAPLPRAVRAQVREDVDRLGAKPARRPRARAADSGGDMADAMWDRIALEDAAVETGLADGSLVTDVRLREALRPGGDDAVSPSWPRTGRRRALQLPCSRRQSWSAFSAGLTSSAPCARSRGSSLRSGFRPMKLVQTLVVRDEADIVDTQIDVPPECRRGLRHRLRPRVARRNDRDPRVVRSRRRPAPDPRAQARCTTDRGGRTWRDSLRPSMARTG